jgi:hypothetical protein
MVDPEDCLWGKDFFETYMEHAEKTSYYNEHLHRAAALSLISQSLKDVFLVSDNTKIDCRIHPFVIQDSGSGKNGAFNFMGAVANEADMDFFKEGTTSTAGIMGTVKRSGEVMPGKLEGDGFLAWKEAQTLIKSANQTHSDDIIEVINMALDPSGDVSKSLAGGTLSYSSRTCLFCTTYPPEPNGQIGLIHQGFLPRMLFLYKKIPASQYDRINKRRDDGLPKGSTTGPVNRHQYDEDVEKLGNTLQYIERQIKKHSTEKRADTHAFALTHKDRHYFERVEEEASMDTSYMFDEMKDDYSYRVQQEVKPFKTRMFDLTYKISAAMAAVDYDEDNDVYVSRVIKKRHADMAHKVVRECWRSIFDFVEDYLGYEMGGDLRKLEHRIKKSCKQGGGKTTVKDVMQMTYLNKKDVKDRLMTLEDMGSIQSNGTPFAAAEIDTEIHLPKEKEEDEPVATQ